MTEHFSSDGYRIAPGAKFWDNNLRVVTVTGVAVDSNPYPDMIPQTWHQTTGGRFDSFEGADERWGRLSRYFEGKDATQYPDGTNYSEADDLTSGAVWIDPKCGHTRSPDVLRSTPCPECNPYTEVSRETQEGTA